MKPKKQVVAATMKDVALKANVSTATVSRALMNPDKVSQATRNRVEQAALEVGYLPQSLGRNMKRNESRTILVIVPDICDPFFSEVIRGIEVTAAEHGYLVHHFYQIVAAVSYRIFMKNVMLVKFFDPARKRRLILQSDRHPAPTSLFSPPEAY